MTQETFNLLNHLSSEGMDSGCYGFVQDENTKEYFGTEEDVNIEGMYLYVYQKKDDFFSHIKKEPEYTFDMEGKENLFLFKLE